MARLTWERVRYRFREPLPTAFGTLHERETLVVRLTGDDGISGHGEAAPLEPYDGVPIAAVEQALARYARALTGLDDGREILAACRHAANLPHALAAIDLALWDRAGKREQRPVCELLSESPSAGVPVNATIGAVTPGQAERLAANAAADGFRCVKVKVGTDGDAERLAAVRAGGGPQLAIRVDANGAWSSEQAIARLPRLADAAGGLEIVEEPVHGRDGLRAVAAALPDLTISSDESGLEGAATVCLKIGRSGGISALCAQAAHVQAFGGAVYLASAFDGPAGIAAAVQCAAALGLELPCGLATLDAFTEPYPDELRPRAGQIAVSRGPGLLQAG